MKPLPVPIMGQEDQNSGSREPELKNELNNLANNRAQTSKNWELIPETNPLLMCNQSYKIVATKKLEPGDLIMVINDPIPFPTYHIKVETKFGSMGIGIGNGTLGTNWLESPKAREGLGNTVSDDYAKSSFHKKFIMLDSHQGNIPKSWICFGCYRSVGPVYKEWCGRCGLPLCSSSCGGHNSNECHDFAALGKNTRRMLNLDVLFFDVAVAKVLMKIKSNPTYIYQFESLFDNERIMSYGKRIGHKVFDNPNLMFFSKKLVKELGSMKLPIKVDSVQNENYFITSIFVMITTTGLPYFGHENTTFFDPIFSFIAHSCFSNTEVGIQGSGLGDFQIALYASTQIQVKEPITINYLNELFLPTQARQKLLIERFNICCYCIRCEDPTEFGTFLGSIRCHECSDGYLTPKPNSFDQDYLIESGRPNTSIMVCTNVQAGCKGAKFSGDVEHETKMFMKELYCLQKESKDQDELYVKFKKMKLFLDKQKYFHSTHMVSILVRLKLFNLVRASNFYDSITKSKLLNDEVLSAQHFISNLMDDILSIVQIFYPKSSRESGIITYLKAYAEKSTLDYILTLQNILTTDRAFLNVAVDRYFAHFINSWKILRLYKCPGDFQIFGSIAVYLGQTDPDEFYKKLQEAFYYRKFEEIEPILNEIVLSAKLELNHMSYFEHRTLFKVMGLSVWHNDNDEV